MENLETILSVLNEKRKEYYKASDIIGKNAKVNSRKGSMASVTLIITGAFIATKGMIDQLMVDGGSDKILSNFALLSYMVIGLIISIVAGLEKAFRYHEKAAGFKAIAVKIKVNMNKVEYAYNLHRSYSGRKGITEMGKTIIELDALWKDINEDASSLGLDLPYEMELTTTKNKPHKKKS